MTEFMDNPTLLYGITILIIIALVMVVMRLLQHKTSDPLKEAQVYIAYGMNSRAIKLLENHLSTNPNDTRAKELLSSINE